MAPSPSPEPPESPGVEAERLYAQRRLEADEASRAGRWAQAAASFEAAAGSLPVEDPRRVDASREAARCRYQEARSRGEDGVRCDDLVQAKAAFVEALRLAPEGAQQAEIEAMARCCESLSEAGEAFRREDWELAETLYQGLLGGPRAFQGKAEAKLGVVRAQRKRAEEARDRAAAQRIEQARQAEEERRAGQAREAEARRRLDEQLRARSFGEALENGRALFDRAMKAQSAALAEARQLWEGARGAFEQAARMGSLAKEDQGRLDHARAAAAAPVGMLYVPAGPFRLGTGGPKDPAGPEQEASIPAYYIGQREVTNREYQRFLEAGADHSRCHPDEPRGKKGRQGHEPNGWDPAAQDPEKPVAGVDWFDAYAYAAWKGMQLPTEPQWEKAAGTHPGTGKRSVYPWGDDFRENLDGLSPNGCMGMANELLEWIGDWYGAYPGGTAESTEFGRTRRGVRGGSRLLDDPKERARVTTRFRASPEKRDYKIGFRVAKAAD